MFDIKTIWEILATVGLSGLVVIILAYAVQIILRVWANRANAQTRQFNVSTQQEEIVNTFAVDFNAERRLWEDRHHKLQEEFTTFRVEAARKDGGLDVLKEMLGQERDKLQKLEVRVQELEKRVKSDENRIQELESERETLSKNVAEKQAAINLLEETIRDLTARVEQETNRANTLSGLVDRLQAIPSTPIEATQPLPKLEDAEKTFIPDIPSTNESAATVAAEETEP